MRRENLGIVMSRPSREEQSANNVIKEITKFIPSWEIFSRQQRYFGKMPLTHYKNGGMGIGIGRKLKRMK